MIISIGGALIDESFSCFENPELHTSNPSKVHRSAGGVSQNISHHLAKLKHEIRLITHMGNDSDGKWLAEHCTTAGIDLSASVFNELPTGKYISILNPDGSLFAGAS